MLLILYYFYSPYPNLSHSFHLHIPFEAVPATKLNKDIFHKKPLTLKEHFSAPKSKRELKPHRIAFKT